MHIQRVSGIGGSENHLLTLLPALEKRGIQISMCVLGFGDHHLFVEKLQERYIDTCVIPAGGDFTPRLIRLLRGEIRRFEPDVVHTHLIHADLYGQVASATLRIPGVFSMHGPNAFYRRQPATTAARVAGRLAKRAIAISEHVARFLIELRISHPRKISTVPYGIDVSDWPDRSHLRLPHQGPVRIGVASRLIEKKGHPLLLRAFKLALESDDRLQLRIAGEGPLRSELERLAQELGLAERVSFLGHVDDVSQFMVGCDLLVFPTQPGLGEGFGLAALEALACGIPVVATRIDSLPEIVLDGVTGYLVQPESVTDMASAILRLARDHERRATMGENARRRVREDFSDRKMADSVQSIYEDVI